MRKFDKVAIVGTGLIGGSIALAMKKNKLCRMVIGISRRHSSLDRALKLGVIDRASLSLDAVREADMIVLAAPVSVILELAPEIARLARKDCLVFDVGSSKSKIVAELSGLFPFFVGTHPLAGSEKKGVAFSRSDLFSGSICIITPSKKTDRQAFLRVKELWIALGCRTMFMSPQEHDKILGFVSHLPHLAAFSLIDSIPEKFLKFAPASLRDMTRVASSDNELWADIILDNRENCLKSLDRFRNELDRISSALRSGNVKKLSGMFNKAKNRRKKFK